MRPGCDCGSGLRLHREAACGANALPPAPRWEADPGHPHGAAVEHVGAGGVNGGLGRTHWTKLGMM